jgi:hypothetical protein
MPALGFVHIGSFFCERISPPVFFRAIAKAFGLAMASLFVSERAIALLACCSALFALYFQSMFAFLLTY